MTLADRIVVLNAGYIAQCGTPLELYRRPQNTFVAGFIGSPRMNFLTIDVTGSANGASFTAGGRAISLPFALNHPATVTLGIRPEDLILTPDNSGPLSFRLEIEEHMGEFRLLYMKADDGSDVIAKTTAEDEYAEGDILHFTFGPAAAHLFDANEQRLPDLHQTAAA